jgi:hypothetical protein
MWRIDSFSDLNLSNSPSHRPQIIRRTFSEREDIIGDTDGSNILALAPVIHTFICLRYRSDSFTALRIDWRRNCGVRRRSHISYQYGSTAEWASARSSAPPTVSANAAAQPPRIRSGVPQLVCCDAHKPLARRNRRRCPSAQVADECEARHFDFKEELVDG